MIGNGSAAEVVVYLTTKLHLVNVIKSYFGNLTFVNAKLAHCEGYGHPSVELPGSNYDYDDLDGDQDSPNSGVSKPRDGKVFVTVVNRTIFNNLYLYQVTDRLMNFNTTVIDSHFTNQSLLEGASRMTELDTDYRRRLDVIRCTFSNSNLSISYIRVNLSIYDSILSVDGFAFNVAVEHGNVIIAGNIFFSNITYDPTVPSTISFFSSNITISGNITFANNKQTPITAYSSTVTLSGNILFVNNTGMNGGALALYSSTLNVDSNTIDSQFHQQHSHRHWWSYICYQRQE